MSVPDNARRVPVWAGMLALLLGIIGYFALGIWLMEAVAWVESCRPQGRNLAYMISALSCSPGLLKQGWPGLGLFAWLWAIPLAIIVGIVLPALKRRRRDRGGA